MREAFPAKATFRLGEPKVIAPVAKKMPADLRRGTKTLRDIKAEVETLRDRAAELEKLAENMKDANVQRMIVDGVTKWDRGDTLVSGYIANIEKALVDAKRNRG
jgi:hypothetical protein